MNIKDILLIIFFVSYSSLMIFFACLLMSLFTGFGKLLDNVTLGWFTISKEKERNKNGK